MKSAADQLDIAREMREHGDFENAVQLSLTLWRFHPENPNVMNCLAISYDEAGRPDLALPVLTNALGRNPKNIALRISISHTHHLLGNDEKALEIADAIIAEAPALLEGYLARANALLGEEKDREALASLEQAAAADPKNADVLIAAGDVLWKNLEQASLALKKYELAAERDPASAKAYFRLAELYKTIGDITRKNHFLDLARYVASSEGITISVEPENAEH
jgi:tetratricopeptide (TPR) repeat protein